VLLFLDTDKSIQLGMVLAVYRGANMSSKGPTKRRMRVSKPSASALTLPSCAAVRLLRLTRVEASSQRFLGCSLSGVALLDPVGHAYLEVKPEKIFQPPERADLIMVRLCSKGIQEFARLKADPELLQQPLAWNVNPPTDEPEATGGEGRVWTYHDFGKSISGTRNIVRFMRELPKLWRDKGMDFLEKDGTYKLAKGGTTSWESLAKRSPEFFEVAFAGSTSKEYGRLVLLQFKILLPDQGAEARGATYAFALPHPRTHPSPSACAGSKEPFEVHQARHGREHRHASTSGPHFWSTLSSILFLPEAGDLRSPGDGGANSSALRLVCAERR
jgi:hypothetical protein